MQGTVVMLMALSGLGCHHKGFSGPVQTCYSSCYSNVSSGCYSALRWRWSTPRPAMSRRRATANAIRPATAPVTPVAMRRTPHRPARLRRDTIMACSASAAGSAKAAEPRRSLRSSLLWRHRQHVRQLL